VISNLRFELLELMCEHPIPANPHIVCVFHPVHASALSHLLFHMEQKVDAGFDKNFALISSTLRDTENQNRRRVFFPSTLGVGCWLLDVLVE
jgi:hypothetical protein